MRTIQAKPLNLKLTQGLKILGELRERKFREKLNFVHRFKTI
jgi:hypothetical protein